MTDREMLELAAKAAGYDVLWHDVWECFVHTNSQNHTNPEVWIPLDDDGDALRLAVKLNMALTFSADGNCHAEGLNGEYACECSSDPFAATRLAIVRAAAEIGKVMLKERNNE